MSLPNLSARHSLLYPTPPQKSTRARLFAPLGARCAGGTIRNGRGWKPHLRKPRNSFSKGIASLPEVRHLAAPRGKNTAAEGRTANPALVTFHSPRSCFRSLSCRFPPASLPPFNVREAVFIVFNVDLPPVSQSFKSAKRHPRHSSRKHTLQVLSCPRSGFLLFPVDSLPLSSRFGRAGEPVPPVLSASHSFPFHPPSAGARPGGRTSQCS